MVLYFEKLLQEMQANSISHLNCTLPPLGSLLVQLNATEQLLNQLIRLVNCSLVFSTGCGSTGFKPASGLLCKTTGRVMRKSLPVLPLGVEQQHDTADQDRT